MVSKKKILRSTTVTNIDDKKSAYQKYFWRIMWHCRLEYWLWNHRNKLHFKQKTQTCLYFSINKHLLYWKKKTIDTNKPTVGI